VADKWQHAQQTGLFLSEDEARYYFRQFVTAVAYCHAHNVAHRCGSVQTCALCNTTLSIASLAVASCPAHNATHTCGPYHPQLSLKSASNSLPPRPMSTRVARMWELTALLWVGFNDLQRCSLVSDSGVMQPARMGWRLVECATPSSKASFMCQAPSVKGARLKAGQAAGRQEMKCV